MTLKKINPTSTNSWKKLQSHFNEIKNEKIVDLLDKRTDSKSFNLNWEAFHVDISKNILDNTTLSLLFDLANECDLKDAISKQFRGSLINETENRAVLHTAVRANEDSNIEVDNTNVIPGLNQTKTRIEDFTKNILSGKLRGSTDKVFTDVVNIGIGGSDLGPVMVVEALKYYSSKLNSHFVSNVDGDHVLEVIKKLNPETTLFVVVSKTFTTQETLSNANTIKNWLIKKLNKNAVSKHFAAVSTNQNAIQDFGIKSDYVFPMNDWVGGRFSLWSAVGLSISLSIGYDNFKALLNGANEMDEHFKNTEFSSNIPVVLAMISIWYNNFFKAETEAVIPYTQYLSRLPAYLQQAIMESNGKSVDRSGSPVNYQTGNIIWGDTGTNSQHAFFQLIHQGTKLIPCDFIGFKFPLHKENTQHNKLMSNFFAQTEALMMGKDEKSVTSELENSKMQKNQIDFLKPFKVFERK